MRQITRRARTRRDVEADLVEADKDRDRACRASDLLRYEVACHRLDDLLDELHALLPNPRSAS